MSVTSTSELLSEAAGVKIYMTKPRTSIDSDFTGKICVILDNIKETKKIGKSCGFHLTKSKWDPYPWISHIETGSLADTSGLRTGDCLLSIDGKDLIGLKIKQIATLIQHYQESNLKLFVWRHINKGEEEKEAGIAIKGPLPEVTSKLANAVSGAVRALECPVCLESSLPPVSQCVHGHIICVGCRSRTLRCPICRVRLGQGRCLLADKLHKMFRDVFDMKDNLCNNVECHTRNLRDRLFGKSKKKEEMRVVGKSNDTPSKTRQLLLSKLFRGSLEKAASADNLTVVSNETSNANTTLIDNLNLDERLNLHDRTKSASTGELSKETIKNVNSNLQINTINTTISSTNSLMSNVSGTPIWGGSMDSVSFTQITCPLSKQSGCKDIITPDMVLKHLSGAHEVPQVHFYSVCARLPVPLPFGSEAVYILHCGEDLFFFQCEDETVWISTTEGKTAWEWTLHGQGQNGTEIKMRRNVASLVNSMVLTSRHIAPLPSALLLHRLDIQLIECRPHEELQI